MGILFSNIIVQWTQYSAQKLFLPRCFNFFLWLFNIYHAVMNLLIIHEKTI